MSAEVIFLTAAMSGGVGGNEENAIRRMVGSLRAFGGELAGSPVWVFSPSPEALRGLELGPGRILPLALSPAVAAYPFGRKVAACAQAEALAASETRTLVWVDPACLILQPPRLFDLGTTHDAAFRPVHIRNIGLPPGAPLDAFWRGVYAALGLDDVESTVTSFVDGQTLRAYFNSHAFAIRPGLGLMRRWLDCFERLVNDDAFQSSACADDIHQTFLFQAILSALIAAALQPGRIRILPPTYNYPYHLHTRAPDSLRAASLNDLVCCAYEDCLLHPEAITDIRIHEPLHSWLAGYAAPHTP